MLLLSRGWSVGERQGIMAYVQAPSPQARRKASPSQKDYRTSRVLLFWLFFAEATGMGLPNLKTQRIRLNRLLYSRDTWPHRAPIGNRHHKHFLGFPFLPGLQVSDLKDT